MNPPAYPIPFPRCGCLRVELRRRTNRGGAVSAVEQCLLCGRAKRTIPRNQLSVAINLLPPWNESLVEAWRVRMHDHAQKARDWYENWKSQEEVRWRQRYEQHLLSEKWQQLRRKVFLRSGGVCEGCAERRATEVHHLTYVRLGNEMLFDLAAVCSQCHEIIHADRESQ